jgi:uncharacterized protein (DUF58 family)
LKLDLNTVRQSNNLEFIARQLVEGFITGLHKSPYHGFSVEFAEHRLYNEGESTRHIDWRVYARTDRLYSKRFEEETNMRCLIAIDRSASMYYPPDSKSKILFSTYAAAALAYMLQKQRDAVGLCLFSDQVELLTHVKSTPTHLNTLMTTLEHLLREESDAKSKEKTSTRISNVLHEVAEKIHKRSLVIIFSDMFDSAEDPDNLYKALQHLKHNKHEVIVFHVLDKATELAFDFEDRPYEFVDLETRERIRLNPHDIREQYQQTVAAFHQQVKLKCNQYKIDYIEADVNEDFTNILQTYLIKRAKMR